MHITLVPGVSEICLCIPQNSKSYTGGRANVAECLLDSVKGKG